MAWAPTSSSCPALPASTWMIASRQAWGTTHDLLSDLLKGDYIKEYIGDYYIGSQEGITAVLTEKRAVHMGEVLDFFIWARNIDSLPTKPRLARMQIHMYI